MSMPEKSPSRDPVDGLAAPVPLADSRWRYVYKRSLGEYRADDWEIWRVQRSQYFDAELAKQILRMLTCQKDDLSYIYTVNNYYHCLQTATRMLRAGLPDEDVVVGLLHDVGFVTCNEAHGELAATLLGPYISERNRWMLRHHAMFQQYHYREIDGCDPNERDRWRGHEHYAWTAEFVEKFDQNTINFDEEILPIEVFEPIVDRFFASARARARAGADEAARGALP